MRLAINAYRLAGKRTGVGRYLLNLLQRWTVWNDSFDEMILYTHAALEKGLVHLPKNFRVEVIAQGASIFTWENFALKRHAQAADVLFCPAYTIPLGYKGKTVVTIHDATQEVLAASFSWWSRLRFAPLYRYSAEKATHIVTDSFAAKKDLLAAYRGVTAEKISVIPLAPDLQFQPVREAEPIARIKECFLKAQHPYILFVGKLSVRRNIPVLIEAFGWLKRVGHVPHQLLLIGLNTPQLKIVEMAERAGVAQCLKHVEYVSDDDLVSLYSGADLFVFPSAYEGFSLPILEAMACGTPVITINSSALKEIVREAALLVDHAEVEALAQAMHRLINDAELRQSLAARGIERAREFSWDRAARETLRVLQSAAGPGRQADER